MVSGAQVRDGRALLGWTARDLARRAHVCVFTVDQIERTEHLSRYPGLATIEATLKGDGIVFLDGVDPMVLLLQKRKKAKGRVIS
jgi:transcriptional regulator with XRE-family HTH domain